MKGTAQLSAVALTVLLLSTVGMMLVESAKADPGPTHILVPIIQINGDGSITPYFPSSSTTKWWPMNLISRNGNTYTLTADDIDYEIQIGCSNIVFDGNGHSLSINHGSNSGVYIGSDNVTVKNIEIFNATFAIEVQGCSHCQITDVKTNRIILLSNCDFNNVTESNMQIWVDFDSENNLITKNNITEVSLSACSNLFYLNNMLLSEPPSIYSSKYFPAYNNSWDNGSIGNYWSNYTTLYPDASEIGYTGLGNTPYIMEGTNIDYHPLMYPYNIENGIALPARTPSPPPTALHPESEPFPTSLAIASVVSVAVVGAGVGLLVFFKKQRRNGGK
jgi:hypothetical protein